MCERGLEPRFRALVPLRRLYPRGSGDRLRATPALRGCVLFLARELEEPRYELGQRRSGVLVSQVEVGVEPLPGDRKRDLRLFEHDRAGEEKGLADLLLGTACAAAAAGGADDRDGLPAQYRGQRGP